MNVPEIPRRERTRRTNGQLIVLEGPGFVPINDANYNGEFGNPVQIQFPAFPEAVELARRANYRVVTSPAFPDGIHQYMGTEILTIPVSFDLHHSDSDYCKKGPYTLLQVAATLEALVLPFGGDRVNVEIAETAESVERTNKAVRDNAARPTQELGGNVIAGEDLYPPPVCYLQLMYTDEAGPGIACRGYVSDVNVKFSGPFMRGPGSSHSLPTKGSYSFTFVHNPGHNNAFSESRYTPVTVKHAYAQLVRQRLFNTLGLETPVNYKGFNES